MTARPRPASTPAVPPCFGHGVAQAAQALFRSLLLLLCCTLSAPALAQCAEGWASLANDAPGPGTVRASIALPNGDIIFGGSFSTAGGIPASNIVRYTPSSGRWAPLGSGINNIVYSLAALPNGDIVAGGFFGQAGGVTANHLARYNPSTGVWSSLGGGLNGQVTALAVLPSGDIVVGGDFTALSIRPGLPATSVGRLARLNPTTQEYSALVANGLLNAQVNALVVLPSGEVIVGGNFTPNGTSTFVNGLARYAPSSGTISGIGFGQPQVSSLALLPGGDLIVGNGLSGVVSRCNLASGTFSSLGSGVSGPGTALVSCLTLTPSGDLIVGGRFTQAGGVNRSRIARYSFTTNTWSSVGPAVSGSAPGINGTVYSLTVEPSTGYIMASGQFGTAGGAPATNFARYNPDANSFLLPATGLSGTVNAVALLPNGDYIVGGTITSAGGVAVSRIARYNPVTNTWSALGSGTNGTVMALGVLPGGDLIVGGQFSLAGGSPANNIARYSFATGSWSTFGNGITGAGAATYVAALAVDAAGTVYIGGNFNAAGTVNSFCMTRLNPATGTWSTMALGPDNAVLTLAFAPNGDLYAGGLFSTVYGGTPANRIARYQPSNGVWFPIGAGFNATVRSLAMLANGDLIAGGDFTSSGATPANRIARFNTGASSWSALGSGISGGVYAIAALADSSLIATGTFFTAGGVTTNGIARWSPATSAWSGLGSGFNGFGSALAVTPAGDVLAGGFGMSMFGEIEPVGLARYAYPAAAITSQPTPQTICLGGVTAFAVTAKGKGPLAYQWNRNGTAIDPATNPSAATASLSLSNLQLTDGGSYTCTVSNACGSTSSNSAVLTVRNTLGVITQQPAPVTACPSSAATFSVTTSGNGPFTYRWRKNGSPINTTINPSAATATLTLASVQAADAASYSCTISTTTCGSVTSTAAALSLATLCRCSPADVAGGEPDGLGPDGTIDGSDFIAFINSFSIGDAAVDALADVAGDGPTGEQPDGTIDGSDFIAFINAFAAGC